MAATVLEIKITNAGGTYNISHTDPPDIVFVYADSAITLSANVVIGLTGYPSVGTTIRYIGKALDQVDLNGFTFTIEGLTYNTQRLLHDFQNIYTIGGSTTVGVGASFIPDLTQTNVVYGSAIIDATLTYDKLEDLTSAQIIVGDGSNRPAAVAVTGDIAITNAGVTSISAGAIVNADVNASAAIARTKLASGTASHVVINDGSGAFSSEAQLATSRGGTGQDTSASTGFATVSAGTWSVGSISYCIQVPVSWESGEQCNNRVKIPFAGTITNIYAVVTKALAGTDAGTIVPKNAAATNMTLTSALSFAASSALETAIDTNVSANNTVAANDIIYLTTAKTTAGGKALVSVKVTRNL